MSSKIEITKNQLICTSYPKGIIALVVIFYLLFLAAIFNTDQALEVIDYIIFHAVLLFAVAIQQHIKTTFNIATGEAEVIKKGIFNKQTTKLKLSEIKNIEMSYGRGSGFSSGGSIVIVTADKRINIASSDLFKRSVLSNQKNQKIMASFLDIDHTINI